MIRLGGKQGSVSLGWPGVLPEPTINGATATYANVMAGVDLELTATAEGYHEVLVVKSAEAAASSELEQVTLSVSGDGLQVVPGAAWRPARGRRERQHGLQGSGWSDVGFCW